jgi:hypothetical protein
MSLSLEVAHFHHPYCSCSFTVFTTIKSSKLFIRLDTQGKGEQFASRQLFCAISLLPFDKGGSSPSQTYMKTPCCCQQVSSFQFMLHPTTTLEIKFNPTEDSSSAMASIRSLLNSPPERIRSLSPSPEPVPQHVTAIELADHSHSDTDADGEYEDEPETYDRAEEIAASVARSMTNTPTQASVNKPDISKHKSSIGQRFDTAPPRTTTNIRPLPLRAIDAPSLASWAKEQIGMTYTPGTERWREIEEIFNHHHHRVGSSSPSTISSRPKAKPKRLLESPITSVADIHFRRFVSPTPSQAPTPSPSLAGSRATTPSQDYIHSHSPSPTPSALYSPSPTTSGTDAPSPRKKLKLNVRPNVTSHPAPLSYGKGHRKTVSAYSGLGKSDKEEKTRVVKDAPVYVEGPTRGDVDYPVQTVEDAVVEVSNAVSPVSRCG